MVYCKLNPRSHLNNANESKFSDICKFLYEECFPKFKIRLNKRKHPSSQITIGIKTSFERKQKLYEKFSKKRNAFNETAFKTYKSLFEAIKRQSKKPHYSQNNSIQIQTRSSRRIFSCHFPQNFSQPDCLSHLFSNQILEVCKVSQGSYSL